MLSETDLRTPEEFNRLIIREVNGYPVRLRDVGRAELGPQDERNRLRVNGQPAVGMGIVKQSTANTLSVARAVKAELPKIRAALPPGMDLDVAFDSSVFIEKSIEAVYEVMVEALLLVVLVIFFFLRSVRATLIPFVTIPVSLIGAFFLIWIMGFTINVLTLLGIVLAIGLVVDDAIVVLENIHRHIEEGMPPHAGRDRRQPRDRVRGGRDDDHAGGGVRAARVLHRQHRAPVHGVRAHRRRRRWWCRASWRSR